MDRDIGIVSFDQTGGELGDERVEQSSRRDLCSGNEQHAVAEVYAGFDLVGRSPLSLLLRYGSYHGALRDVRAGAHHGAYCLGCCWSLMALFVVLGVMPSVAAGQLGPARTLGATAG
jgi:hypothetical protein